MAPGPCAAWRGRRFRAAESIAPGIRAVSSPPDGTMRCASSWTRPGRRPTSHRAIPPSTHQTNQRYADADFVETAEGLPPILHSLLSPGARPMARASYLPAPDSWLVAPRRPHRPRARRDARDVTGARHDRGGGAGARGGCRWQVFRHPREQPAQKVAILF